MLRTYAECAQEAIDQLVSARLAQVRVNHAKTCCIAPIPLLWQRLRNRQAWVGHRLQLRPRCRTLLNKHCITSYLKSFTTEMTVYPQAAAEESVRRTRDEHLAVVAALQGALERERAAAPQPPPANRRFGAGWFAYR